MLIKYLGHSAFMVEGSKKILFDPFLSGNPKATVGPLDLNPDYILVSHGHGDHFGDALEISRASGAVIVAPNELALYCGRRGAEIHPMHIGGAHVFSADLKIKLTAALHGSAITEEGISQYLGMPCGFLLFLDGKTIYFAGDTALTYDMKTVIGDLNRVDVAMLPIGDNYTMGPEDAAVAVKWINPRIIIPMHYNTFPLIEQNAGEFCDKVEKDNPDKKVFVLDPGQNLEI